MRIVRINKGKYLHWSIRFLGAIIIVLSVIKTLRVVPEPWSVIVSAFISILLPIIWFTNKIIVIDLEKNVLFDGIWVMGFKIGETRSFQHLEKFFFNKVKTKQTVYSLSNKQNIVANHEYQAYVKIDSGEKFYLLSHPLEERIIEKLTKIKQKLEVKDS